MRPPLDPDSRELVELITDNASRLLYRFLYERIDSPPSMVEIRDHFLTAVGEIHSQTDRRVRGLRDVYGVIVECKRIDHAPRYVLKGVRESGSSRRRPISRRIRAQVLLSQRCAQCGKMPDDDGVKLEVDHKLPLAWGGDDDVENLQALCQECNHGKRDYFSSIDQYAEQIRKAASWLEPHKRIGEVLKAFKASAEPAPSAIIGLVASMHQYQDDWQKRLRELKELGWQYKVNYRYENGRRRSYYQLISWQPWPEGDIASVIRRLERARKGLR